MPRPSMKAIRRALAAAVLVSELVLAAPAGAAKEPKVATPPSSIANDCSADVTATLTAWFRQIRPRSRVELAPGGCYRVEGSLRLDNLAHLVIDGNGSTVKATTGGVQGRRHVTISGSKDLDIRNLAVRGVKPQDVGYVPTRAFQHGFALAGSTDIRLTNVGVYDVYGDFVYVGPGPKGVWSQGVRVTDSVFGGAGRQGIAITAGRDIVIDGNWIDGVGRSMFDIEANSPDGGAENVRVTNNQTGDAQNFWLANGGAGVNVREIVFRDNVMFEPTGGLVYVFGPEGGYRGPYVIANNTLSTFATAHDEGSKGAIFLRRASDVTIRGNTVTLPRGKNVPAVENRDSIDVVLKDNLFENAGEGLLVTGSTPQTQPRSSTPTTAR